jgi:hypothetical protein
LAAAAVGTIAWLHLSSASSETPAGARANPSAAAELGDPSKIKAVAQYLAAQAATKPEVEGNEASQRTVPKGKSSAQVSVVKLEHH